MGGLFQICKITFGLLYIIDLARLLHNTQLLLGCQDAMSAFQRPSSPDPFADEERPSGRSLEGSLTITTDPLQVLAHQQETGHEAVGQTLQKIHGDGVGGVPVSLCGEVLRATKGNRMKQGR